MAAWTKLLHRFIPTRTFVNARVKWVRDPYLDFAVEREKNLIQAISFKDQICSDPSKSLPLSIASLLKPRLDLTITSAKFFQKYPSFFSIFQPSPGLPRRVKLTRQALSIHREEYAVHSSLPHRYDAVHRLARLLMLTGAARLPIYVIERLKWDLGLPHNFVVSLVIDFPDYFQVCEVDDPRNGRKELALELVSWRKELALSELEKKALNDGYSTKRIAFPMFFPRGFDLEKKIKDWVEEWQRLPYISPYENGFHLSPNSDQAEKWTVAVLHELLWLMVSKKTDRDNLFCLGEYLGFGSMMFKKALVHHPGIFYLSNKIRTQTVVLREAYRKDFLLEKHPLMGIRYRYIHLLNKVPMMIRKPAIGSAPGSKPHDTTVANGVGRNLSFEGTNS
ncbi:protein WHAT'S THIS FACTOR 9, mitochondrial [Humulus lupulus]|uniref:protein WHAT'S THIS FACTOR 9, mitochondrial n=1 Tax=Humulus lupulus TaxID=3486 RepID=UPI002B40DCE1|nr:protein WHAT'S THIS FACTOR 9, mitochondrial [Humulus lupulus]